MKYETYEYREGMSLLRPKVVEKRTGLCRAEIDRRREAGRFPPPIKLGPLSIAWPDYVIDEYIRDLTEGRLR
jgi:prophage regulatory protein